MGRKVNPISFRIQVNKEWLSKWYSKKDYKKYLHEDIKIRDFVTDKFGRKAGISKVEIERNAAVVSVNIYTSRPGVLIGRGGAGAVDLKNSIQKMTTGQLKDVNIQEIREAEMDAKLVAENIASQIERRMAYKRVTKSAMERSLKAGAKGVKILVSGRLNGAEIARREPISEGKIPLQTIKANVDYGIARAYTTYGVIGIKVWIYKGETRVAKNVGDK